VAVVSALYGYLRGSRGTATRAGSERITAELQTWDDRLSLTLDRDGSYTLSREPGPNGCGPRVLIACGQLGGSAS
jgi:hypothetical protein